MSGNPAFRQSRHFTLAARDWDADEALHAIREIADDAIAHLDDELWPAHPLDDDLPDGTGSLYFGASGIIWALDHLRHHRVIDFSIDLMPLLLKAAERNAPWYDEMQYRHHASFLMGDLGIKLVMMKLAPSAVLADLIYLQAAKNSDLPPVELMWGMAGSMLACVHMNAMTADPRFRQVFERQAARLFSDIEDGGGYPIWTQDLYGQKRRLLGPVHGFAGNMIPLIRGWDWLSPPQRKILGTGVPETLAATAVIGDAGVNWPVTASGQDPQPICHYCRGAPGIVATFGNAPFSTPILESLLLKGGDLIWAAGPLVKGSNLCHGTGGNGYAFLRLYKRTGNPVWLDRARLFAATAIVQVRAARTTSGRGRYSLWTGDLGLAVFLLDCIRGDSDFPTIDIF